jgi:hypothetical protein
VQMSLAAARLAEDGGTAAGWGSVEGLEEASKFLDFPQLIANPWYQSGGVETWVAPTCTHPTAQRRHVLELLHLCRGGLRQSLAHGAAKWSVGPHRHDAFCGLIHALPDAPCICIYQAIMRVLNGRHAVTLHGFWNFHPNARSQPGHASGQFRSPARPNYLH